MVEMVEVWKGRIFGSKESES